MAKKAIGKLPDSTIIEVFKIKGDQVKKKRMTYGEALRIKKSKGWTYINYELGYSSLKEN